MGRLDPWGHFTLSDLISAARAQCDITWRHNHSLVEMFGNAFFSEEGKMKNPTVFNPWKG